MRNEDLLELVQATLEGQIKGFNNGIQSLGDKIYPETKSKITFAITELEEVLDLIKQLKD